MRRMNSLFFAALLCASVGLLSGCGTDDASSYTLAIVPSSLALTSDGSDASTIRVTILDQRGNPPAVGSTVALTVLNGSVNNVAPEAIVDAGGTTTLVSAATALTDPAGTAQFRVSCVGTEAMSFRASFDGERETGRSITCNPAPSGDWQLSMVANPRSVAPGGAVALEVTATQGNGEPAPTGTAITFTIQDPNPGAVFRTGAGTVQAVTIGDDSGTLTNVVVAPSTAENFTVCASFVDSRLGTGNPCTTVRVGATQVTGAACFGVYSPSKLPADGESTSVLSFSVYNEAGTPAADALVAAEIFTGQFLRNPDDANSGVGTIALETEATGLAEVTVLAPSETGSASVIATATIPGMDEPLICDFSDELIFAPPPTCQFDPVAVVALNQTAPLRVCFDDVGVPVSSGLRVDFELTASVTGATLIATTAYTGTDGCAVTSLVAGSSPGAVTIEAEMPFGRRGATCNSSPVLQAGGSGSATQMVVACENKNLGVLLHANGDDTYSTCPTTCTANVLDNFNNPVVGQAVYFTSEVGTIVASAVTNERGIAAVEFTGRGSRPRDVVEFGDMGEIVTETPEGRRLNMRDSLVTIVASTAGAEEFNDDNGNGRYDEGEFFIDLSEPFVDSDESNNFEPGSAYETFTDVATAERPLNGTFDGPNGLWDSQTQIWGATHILYSGPSVAPFLYRANGTTVIPLTGTPSVAADTQIFVRPRDEYGNPPSNGTVSITFDNKQDDPNQCSDLYSAYEAFGYDTYGEFSVRRELQFFSGGREVSAETADVDFARYRTELTFGLGGGLELGVAAAQPGDCRAQFSWTETASASCGDSGGVDRSTLGRWSVR